MRKIKVGVMIGILAGMGPKSTGPFINQVVHAFQILSGAKDDIDFPPMMVHSLSTPFYIDRSIDHKLMEITICEGLKKLEACRVTFIATPCNAAHHYFSILRQCIKIPLLNMIEIMLNRIPKSVKKVTLLGTRSTLESGVYQKGFDHAHFEYVFNPAWQVKIDEMLLNIKASSDQSTAIKLWSELSDELRITGVEAIVLACTDLNVMTNPSHSSSLPINDSCYAAADATA